LKAKAPSQSKANEWHIEYQTSHMLQTSKELITMFGLVPFAGRRNLSQRDSANPFALLDAMHDSFFRDDFPAANWGAGPVQGDAPATGARQKDPVPDHEQAGTGLRPGAGPPTSANRFVVDDHPLEASGDLVQGIGHEHRPENEEQNRIETVRSTQRRGLEEQLLNTHREE